MKNLLNNNFFEEMKWIRNKIHEYKDLPIFYLWIVFSLFFIIKLWKVCALLTFCISIVSMYTILYKQKIIIKNGKKISMIWWSLVINFLKNLENNKLSADSVNNFLFRYVFRLITGLSLKFLRLVVALFDSFYKEYKRAEIVKKKKTYLILKKFVSIAFEDFVLKEFVKKIPTLEKKMTFVIKKNIFLVEIIIIEER